MIEPFNTYFHPFVLTSALYSTSVVYVLMLVKHDLLSVAPMGTLIICIAPQLLRSFTHVYDIVLHTCINVPCTPISPSRVVV